METTDTVLNKIKMDDIMDYDVFLSYPHADRIEVMQICEALRARELTVWMDESDIPDYASITRSIVDGLARSRVLLAYYSLNYSRSRACQWELTAAFLAAQHGGDPQRRVLVINPENEWEHIQPVELKDAEIPNSDDLDSLASRVKNHVDEIKGTIGEIHAIKPPEWYGRKGLGSNRFVGRLHYMWQIHSALHASDFPIITMATATYEVVQIYGMGGVGKSLLTEEYALRFAAAFPGGVFWLSAFGNDDVKTGITAEEREAERFGQIMGIAATLGIPVQDRNPDEIEGDLVRELGSREKPFLWVVDDLPAGMGKDTLQGWLAPHPLGKTLITTRTREHDSMGSLIRLDVLEPEEGCDLLTSRRKPEGEKEKDAACDLVEDLGCHALAIEVAGAALHASNSSRPFADFRQALTKPNHDELEFAKYLIGTLPNGHEKSIAATLLRSIELLCRESAACTGRLCIAATFLRNIKLLKDEKCSVNRGCDFLLLASVLAVAPIPTSLVSYVFCEVDGLDETSGKRRADHAIHKAEELSLAQRAQEWGAISIHTLISRTVRFKNPMPERSNQLHDAAIKVLTAKFKENADDPRTHGKLELLVAHARELIGRGDDILQTTELVSLVAQYDFVNAKYKSAEKLWRCELEFKNHILGTEHPSTLTSMNNLAVTLQAQGELERAREIHEKVLEKRRRLLGAEHPDTIASMGNLATTLHAQGELEKAREILTGVLEKRRQIFGVEHPKTLTSMGNLASTLHSQGELEKAREIQEKKLGITRRVLGGAHSDTLTSMSQLAMTLKDQGEIERARGIQEEVLEKRRQIFGAKHPDTLASMGNLAITLCCQGEIERARNVQKGEVETMQQILGAEHPDTLTSMSNLATTLQTQGKLERAREIYEEVLEKRRQIFGVEHSDTLASMGNLATTLHAQGELEKAREIQEEALGITRRILGGAHSDTIRSMSNFAVMLKDQGEIERAREILEEVLNIRRRILGAEHPDTITSMSNLAMTLQTQGNIEKAREILEEVLDTRRRILGAEHPDTITSMSNLAVMLKDQGEIERAREILEEVLNIRRRILGAEHPDTITSMSNLAVMLNDQGEIERAREILEEVLDIRRRILGAKHPDTSISAWNLFNNLIEIDNPDEAQTVLETDLLWLLDRDPASLGANQREIRGTIFQMTDEVKKATI